MLKAMKENKVYTIDEAHKDRYLSEGFDIYDENGNVTEYSPLKKVLYSEYVKLQKENEELRKENADLEAQLASKGTKKAGA